MTYPSFGHFGRHLSPFAQRLGWIILTITLVALVASVRVSIPLSSSLVDFGPAGALSAPALWLSKDTKAVIWKPSEIETGLLFQPLDGSPGTPVVAYPSLTFESWRIAPVDRTTFHLVWLENDGRLQSSIVNTAGTTLRGPVELSSSAGPDFAIVPQADGSAIVVWTNTRSRHIAALQLDLVGRPGPVQVFSAVQSDRMAATYDNSGMLHIAWLTPTEPQTWTLFWATLSPDLTLETPISVATLPLLPEEVLSSLEIGITNAHLVSVIGITNAHRPDVEQLSVVSTALEAPQASDPVSFWIPSGCRTPNEIAADAPAISDMHSSNGADLRWPRLLPGPQPNLTMAVACRTVDGWRPFIITLEPNGLLTYRQAADMPMDVAPPALAADANGQAFLTWLGLADDAQPHLFATQLDQDVSQKEQSGSPTVSAALIRGLLAGLAIGWAWMLIPAALLRIFPHNPWTVPMALMLFGAEQLLWPAGLFAAVPDSLQAVGLIRGSPEVTVGSMILVIGGIAWMAMTLVHRAGFSAEVQWLAFGFVDTLLIWAVFGSNLV